MSPISTTLWPIPMCSGGRKTYTPRMGTTELRKKTDFIVGRKDSLIRRASSFVELVCLLLDGRPDDDGGLLCGLGRGCRWWGRL